MRQYGLSRPNLSGSCFEASLWSPCPCELHRNESDGAYWPGTRRQYRFAYEVTNTDIARLAVHDGGTIALTSWTSGPEPVAFGDAELALGIDSTRRFVAVLDPDGAPKWARALDPELPQHDPAWPAGTVAFDRDGNVLVEHGNLGGTVDPGDFDQPERLSKLDENGALVWSREVSPPGWVVNQDPEGAVAADAQGNIVHTSELRNDEDSAPPDFPVQPTDAVVQKLAPDGTLLWRHLLSRDIYDDTFGLVVAPDDSIWVGLGTPYLVDGTLHITKLAP